MSASVHELFSPQPGEGVAKKPQSAADASPEKMKYLQQEAERIVQKAAVVADTRDKIRNLEGAVGRTKAYADFMDKKGAEAIVGAMIPELGDVATGVAGLYIVAEALIAGVPQDKIVKMLVNLAIDTGAGLIPVVGDVFDFFWHANAKNAEILRKYLEELKAQQQNEEGMQKAA